MIAETEAERLGRALVFAESEAKSLLKELNIQIKRNNQQRRIHQMILKRGKMLESELNGNAKNYRKH